MPYFDILINALSSLKSSQNSRTQSLYAHTFYTNLYHHMLSFFPFTLSLRSLPICLLLKYYLFEWHHVRFVNYAQCSFFCIQKHAFDILNIYSHSFKDFTSNSWYQIEYKIWKSIYKDIKHYCNKSQEFHSKLV